MARLKAHKPTPKPDNPEQSKRFIETAREIGTDESDESFKKAFDKVAPKPKAGPVRRNGRRDAS
jgi:hypothetical protein